MTTSSSATRQRSSIIGGQVYETTHAAPSSFFNRTADGRSDGIVARVIDSNALVYDKVAESRILPVGSVPSVGPVAILLGGTNTSDGERPIRTFRHTQRRYRVGRQLGVGTFGCVWRAQDIDSDPPQPVALKQMGGIEDALRAKKALREIRLLRFVRHENIIRMHDVVVSPPGPNFLQLYLVCELMQTDLRRVLQSGQQLSTEQISVFLYQILRGVKYLHTAGIVHRDLKPENILVNADLDLRLADLGSGRGPREPSRRTLHLTLLDNVTTRYYRAPEGLLESRDYDYSVDIWSTGCIFAELLLMKPLFPGENTYHQLETILKIRGTPLEKELECFPPRTKKYMREQLPRFEAVPLRQLFPAKKFPNATDKALGLMDALLRVSPRERIDAAEALGFAFLSHLHDETDEPSASTNYEELVGEELWEAEEYHRAIFREAVEVHMARIEENRGATKQSCAPR